MSKCFGGLAAALLLASASLPASAQPEAQAADQPARWHLDGSTTRCVLTRRLAGSPVPATFILRTLPGSGRYEIILGSPDFPAEIRQFRGEKVSLSLTPGMDGSVEVPGSWVDLPDSLGQGLAIGPLPADLMPVFAASTSLVIGAEGGGEAGRWTVPVAGRAAEAVSYCESEKLAEWGADPAGLADGATRAQPSGDTAGWVTPRQLGLNDTLASLAYTGVYRLGIGTDGRVTDCALLESAGNVDLSLGCRILTRVARYSPARDAAGKAVRSVAVHVVDVRRQTDIRFIEG